MTQEIDIYAAVASMPLEFAHCRDYGHAWKPFQVYLSGRNYERVLRCDRCATQCLQLVAKKNGRLTGGRRYIYPDGYLIKGLGAFSSQDRGVVRLASLEDDMKQIGS